MVDIVQLGGGLISQSLPSGGEEAAEQARGDDHGESDPVRWRKLERRFRTTRAKSQAANHALPACLFFQSRKANGFDSVELRPATCNL